MNSRTLRWLLAVTILCGAGLLYARHRAARLCARPIEYSVGVIDPRFQLIGDRLVDDAAVAATIWNQAAGRNILAYRPSAPLKINLIYDARQQNAALGVAVDQLDAGQDSARKVLASFQDRVARERALYNTDVQLVNARGGATADESRALETRRLELDRLSDTLRIAVETFNARNAAIKSTVDRLNQQAGQTFTAGRYVRDATGERIDVFRFIGDTALTRMLAHEFGHALGLPHNDDSTSIMYAMDERGNLKPSTADMGSLRKRCGR